MKTRPNAQNREDLRPEYDFARMKGGVRGKYAKAYRKGTNLVLLAPDVARQFPDDRSVNDALRALISVSRRAVAHAR
ncbi:MAG: hypothetical protein ACLQVA_12620 [Candidatus Brocadiia bacterium]